MHLTLNWCTFQKNIYKKTSVLRRAFYLQNAMLLNLNASTRYANQQSSDATEESIVLTDLMRLVVIVSIWYYKYCNYYSVVKLKKFVKWLNECTSCTEIFTLPVIFIIHSLWQTGFFTRAQDVNWKLSSKFSLCPVFMG